MVAEPRTTRACRGCGAVTGKIFAKHRPVDVDMKPVLIHENPRGDAYGYTLDGRPIRGDIVDTQGCRGAWEVFREHKCPEGGQHGLR